ncbi:MAG: phosphopantothenoylcysteine decarboxylase [Pirellulaceae bacterium]
MAKILITSGPTRQYLDPVRFISNASSGEMGRCIAQAAVDAGHDVTIVTGPVSLKYPDEATVTHVLTTREMLDACLREFEASDGMIGVAAPCDYQPTTVSDHKIKKTGQPITLQLIQTPDIVATLGQQKRADQWVVGFALETEDAHFRAVTKLEKKCCDLVVVNGPEAMNASTNAVDIVNPAGHVVANFSGSKSAVGGAIFLEIQTRLIDSRIAVSRED